MKHAAILSALAVLTLAACDKNPADEPFVPPAQTMPASPSSATDLPPGHPMVGGNAPMMMSAPMAPSLEQSEQATVVSTIDIEGFTYIEIKQDNQTRWLAANAIPVKKGTVIKFDRGSTIHDFTSKTLNRTFPSMTFVNTVTIVKGK